MSAEARGSGVEDPDKVSANVEEAVESIAARELLSKLDTSLCQDLETWTAVNPRHFVSASWVNTGMIYKSQCVACEFRIDEEGTILQRVQIAGVCAGLRIPPPRAFRPR